MRTWRGGIGGHPRIRRCLQRWRRHRARDLSASIRDGLPAAGRSRGRSRPPPARTGRAGRGRGRRGRSRRGGRRRSRGGPGCSFRARGSATRPRAPPLRSPSAALARSRARARLARRRGARSRCGDSRGGGCRHRSRVAPPPPRRRIRRPTARWCRNRPRGGRPCGAAARPFPRGLRRSPPCARPGRPAP